MIFLHFSSSVVILICLFKVFPLQDFIRWCCSRFSVSNPLYLFAGSSICLYEFLEFRLYDLQWDTVSAFLSIRSFFSFFSFQCSMCNPPMINFVVPKNCCNYSRIILCYFLCIVIFLSFERGYSTVLNFNKLSNLIVLLIRFWFFNFMFLIFFLF